jgi:hypothetical protein
MLDFDGQLVDGRILGGEPGQGIELPTVRSTVIS